MKGKKCPNCRENALYVRFSIVKNGIGDQFVMCSNCHSYFNGQTTEMNVYMPHISTQKSALKEIKNIREKNREQSKEKLERNI